MECSLLITTTIQNLLVLLSVQTVSFAGCDITAKAEHLNPGGSVKDRAALYLIKEAEEKGL